MNLMVKDRVMPWTLLALMVGVEIIHRFNACGCGCSQCSNYRATHNQKNRIVLSLCRVVDFSP